MIRKTLNFLTAGIGMVVFSFSLLWLELYLEAYLFATAGYLWILIGREKRHMDIRLALQGACQALTHELTKIVQERRSIIERRN